MNMSGFKMRKSLETMEEYSVEHVEADIIANANESNYPMPQKVVESKIGRASCRERVLRLV